ncbi:MAG: hypothetical protein KJZ69_05160 [Phycisphaerales bacterium]|nr:hypothetical protein [Phycisphaerales bacterium]
MSKTYNFGRTFKTNVQNGKTPYSVVENIAGNCRKTTAFVWNNLKKNGYAFNTKFNGKTFWFPSFNCKTNSTNCKKTENTIWPQMIQYALQQGWITPAQCYNWTTNQICWHVSNCFNKGFRKPAGFNPNVRGNFKPVKGCPGYWTSNGTWNNYGFGYGSGFGYGTGNTTRKTGKTTRTYKGKTRRTNKTRSRRTGRTTGLRLVGTGNRYGTRRYSRRAA